MWRLPDGRTITVPVDITIEDVCYPAMVFRRWTKEDLNAHGIKPFREASYDNKYFVSTSSEEIETDGEIVKTHTVAPRYTNQEVKNVFVKMIKLNLRNNWMHAKEELEYLETFDIGAVLDMGTWQQYMMDLKDAAGRIKTAFQNLTSYEEAIEFIKTGYSAMLPIIPFQEEQPIT